MALSFYKSVHTRGGGYDVDHETEETIFFLGLLADSGLLIRLLVEQSFGDFLFSPWLLCLPMAC